MTVRRIILACLAVALMGGSALLGAAAGGAAVFVAARGWLASGAIPNVDPVVGNSVAQNNTVNVDINSAVEGAVTRVSPAVVTVINDLAAARRPPARACSSRPTAT